MSSRQGTSKTLVCRGRVAHDRALVGQAYYFTNQVVQHSFVESFTVIQYIPLSVTSVGQIHLLAVQLSALVALAALGSTTSSTHLRSNPFDTKSSLWHRDERIQITWMQTRIPTYHCWGTMKFAHEARAKEKPQTSARKTRERAKQRMCVSFHAPSKPPSDLSIQQAYTWEASYTRSWDTVQEDETGSLQGAVEDLMARGRRRRHAHRLYLLCVPHRVR